MPVEIGPDTKRTDYSALDFQEWNASGTLEISPKFQRRAVWSPAARSFLIDSILRNMPIPPVYLREMQSQDNKRTVREVVDGQQRIRAVLEFMENKYKLTKAVAPEWQGKTFDSLRPEEQDRIRNFLFVAIVFRGVNDDKVLEIFSRLNKNSVVLNSQELRNGKYFGDFKQSVYATAYEHLEFWRRHKVFTETAIARMLEAEFVSEVYIAFIDGMQDKKKSIDKFYSDFDDEFPDRQKLETRFKRVVDVINETADPSLQESVFRRPPLLYTLFCVVYHYQYGLPEAKLASPKRRITKSDILSLREAIASLSEKVDLGSGSEDIDGVVPKKYVKFVQACIRQTDNIKPRNDRFSEVYKAAFG